MPAAKPQLPCCQDNCKKLWIHAIASSPLFMS